MSGIAITFPSSPIEGQSYLAQNGFTYIYDSQKNRWKRSGDFVRAPKVLSYAGVAATTTGSGITTGPNGALIYNVPGVVSPNAEVGVDSYKAYRYSDSYPNYTEIQVSISSAFSTIAYAATFTGTTYTVPSSSLSGDTTYYVRARQFVGPTASAASTGAISGYSPNIVRFITTSVYIDAPTIVSIAGSTRFPVYQIGFAQTTLPATVTYTGSGAGNLEKVDWRVTGPRNPDSTGDTALAEVGIGTFSSATLANALVLAMPFSGATGVGITNDVNGAIRTASGASAGTTKTVTANGGIGTASVGIATTTAHFYQNAAYFVSASNQSLSVAYSSDFDFGTADFTVEFWLYYMGGSGGFYGLFGKTQSPTDWSGLWAYINTSSNKIVYETNYPTNITGTRLTGNSVISRNTWTHISIVRKSGLVSIYVNGYLDGVASDLTSSDVSQPFTIGIARQGMSGAYINAYYQDFKVYKGLAKYTENFTPPLPTYGTISYTTRTIGSVGVATTAFNKSTGDIPTAEVAIGSSTAAQVASSLVLAMPMNRTFGFQDINVAIRGLTSGASAGTAKTVGLGTTSTANAPTHPRISSTESKWYDGAAYFDGGDYLSAGTSNDYLFGTGDFTIESWFNLSTNASRQDLCGNYSGASTGWGVALGDASSNGMYFYYGNTTYATTSAGLWSTNTWNHIAISRQSGTLSIYLNGNRVSSASATVDVSTTSYSTLIGAVTDTSGNPQLYCTGYLQDLKIYKGFAKYTANFTPPRPICGFTTDLAIQTGFTTTSATGVALTSIVGLGSTSTLAFGADQTYAGITSITSSSGITTLPDPYAQNLVLALPLANITGVGNSFTNDRNTQIRSVSITGAGVTAGTTKTITNTGVTTVSLGSTGKWYGNTGYFDGGDHLPLSASNNFYFGTNDFTIETWINYSTSGTVYSTSSDQGDWKNIGTGYFNLNASGSVNYINTSNSEANFNPTITTPTNQWCHLAFVKSRNTLTCYLNGVFNGQATNINSILGNSSSGVPAISKWDGFSGGRGYITGYLQDYRIYDGVAKYTTNFTPPPPMFGDYTRSTPNKIILTPGSDYVLEARNTATGGIVTSTYSATRQWGTKPKGGIYDPYGANLVLAIPGGAVGGATSTFDVTGQIRFETPTATYVNAGIVTYSNSLGIGTYQNKTTTNVGLAISTSVAKYYGRSMYLQNAQSQQLTIQNSSDFQFPGDFTIELWYYPTTSSAGDGSLFVMQSGASYFAFNLDKSSNFFNLYLNISSGTTYTASASSVNVGSWNHITWCRKNGILQIYVNGISISQYSNSSTVGYSNPDFTRIGGGASGALNANINDFRIYKGVAKYTSNFTPPNQIYLT